MNKPRHVKTGKIPPRAGKKRALAVRPNRRRNIRLQTLGDIAAVLGHESRNLFGALKTCLIVLRSNSNLSNDDRELLDIIEAGARRLGDVMADFAIFSRIAPPRLKEFALPGLLDDLFSELQQRHPTLAIIRHLSPTVANVRADREQLRQALWHLLWNGAQAAGPEGSVTIKTARAKRGWQVTISDSGPGIAVADLDRIFEPLYTTKPRSAGLGLAVARRIIEYHGGRLLAQSRPRAGARFIVEIPSAGTARRGPTSYARKREG